MGNMYNLVCGKNVHAAILLWMIGLKEEDFGRFRDCYLNSSGNKIIVLTRCGGGNREDYEYVFDKMKMENEYFIKDYDDDFDCTYCYFEFKVPEKYESDAKKLLPIFGMDDISLEKKFENALEKLDIKKEKKNV